MDRERGRTENLETTILKTFIRVCAWCKKSLGFESHVSRDGEHFAFTHGACQECLERVIKEVEDEDRKE
jgi:hypothetical protein